MSTTVGPWAAGGTRATMLSERFVDALGYAARVHRGQTRRDCPYVAHLLRVTGLVLEDGGTEDEAIGALPHDAAEDHGGYGRLRDIRRRYGHAVADIVDSCTDSYEHPKPSWHVRKEQYVEHLCDAPPSALRVSLADKVDNVRALLHDLQYTDVRPGTAASSRTHDAGSQDLCWYYGTSRACSRCSSPAPAPTSSAGWWPSSPLAPLRRQFAATPSRTILESTHAGQARICPDLARLEAALRRPARKAVSRRHDAIATRSALHSGAS